jgi:hypothetical protein
MFDRQLHANKIRSFYPLGRAWDDYLIKLFV